MSEKKLSEELSHCLEERECLICDCWESETLTTCKGLLQKAYEMAKKYEGMFPCKVGDTVYRIHKGTETIPGLVYECKVTGVKQEFNTFSVKLHANINEENYSIWIDNWFDRCQVGHEFFLTNEEAEKVLTEMDGEKRKCLFSEKKIG